MNNKEIKQNTILYSHPLLCCVCCSLIYYGAGISSFPEEEILIWMVIMFVLSYNPQITKARWRLFFIWNLFFYIYNFPLQNFDICSKFKHASRYFRGHTYVIYLFSSFLRVQQIFQLKCSIGSLSQAIKRLYSFNSNKDKENLIFNQWLAGLIDGDGCFLLSKKGYASLEIVAHVRDKNCLFQIKNRCGGSIKVRNNLNHLRYRLHHKKGLLDLISRVNGEIRNPIRLLQLNRICENYNIDLIQPNPLTYFNGWFSGFFDSDGSVYLNLNSSQMFITASQKNKFLLDIISELYGGSVYTEKTSFKWFLYKKSEVLTLLEYFITCPCRSAKLNRIKAIKKYYELRDLKAHLAKETSILGKIWQKYLVKWDKWEK